MTRANTRLERAIEVFSTMLGSDAAGRSRIDDLERHGALGQIAVLTGAGEIWARTELSRRDRSLAAISMLTVLGREADLGPEIIGGLNHGLSHDEIDEVFVQISAYAGLPVALAGAEVASQVFADRDATDRRKSIPSPLAEKTPEQRRSDGLNLLKTLLGLPDLDTKQTEEQIRSSQGAMGDLVMDYAFGDVWTRPQLSRRDRSFVVISVLAALNLKHELEIHVRGALNHGVTRTEIEEMLMTLVLYGGFPRAIDGMIVARSVFERVDASS